MKSKKELLTLLGLILGVILGVFFPEFALYFKFIGTTFIALLKVLILPIIIVSLFLAIAQISSVTHLKKIGIRTIIYYFSTTAVAVLCAIVTANFFIFDTTTFTTQGVSRSTSINMVEHVLSTNIFESLANGHVLHVVVFVLLFSLAFSGLSEDKKKPMLDVAKVVNEVILKLINWVLIIAPVGVCSLVWTTVSTFDSTVFDSLQNFFIATSIVAFLHSFIILPIIAKLYGNVNIYTYFLKVKEAVVVALVTASSSASLPVSINVSEAAGVQPKVAQFVLPLGATLNMDGSALYQSLLVMLFVNLAGMDLDISQQLLLFVFIALSSAGTAGVPSGGIVMVTMVLNLLKIPNIEYYIGLYIMVDRFWDYPITAVNVWSDLVGARTVSSQVEIY